MESLQQKKQKKEKDPQRVKIRNYMLLTLLATVVLLMIMVPYSELVSPSHEGQLSVFLTALFITCVFIGRYLSVVWISGQRPINNKLYVFLGTAMTVSAFILFVQAQVLSNSPGHPLPMNIFLSSALVTLFATCLGILIKVTRYSVSTQLIEAKASAAQSKSELHFLQSQLSPHFLFNTLNNLYGISLSQHEKIPSLLLKLSDLLRYSVYEAKGLYVPLSEEIKYIKNYIDFERLRVGERLELDVSIEEVYGSNVHIAPLLLMVFIENAFKHSKNTLSEKVQISITLKTFGKDILFAVSNSYDPTVDAAGKEGYSGLGLENVRKRLDLLYPGKYEMSLQSKDNVYSVKLQLKES